MSVAPKDKVRGSTLGVQSPKHDILEIPTDATHPRNDNLGELNDIRQIAFLFYFYITP